MGDSITRDLEKVGEEWRKRATYGRNWRLTKNVVRGRKKTMETEIIVNSLVTTGVPRKEQQHVV